MDDTLHHLYTNVGNFASIGLLVSHHKTHFNEIERKDMLRIIFFGSLEWTPHVFDSEEYAVKVTSQPNMPNAFHMWHVNR